MEVDKFYIEESIQNKGSFILVVETKDGNKFVVGGDPYMTTYLKPYDDCFYTDKSK